MRTNVAALMGAVGLLLATAPAATADELDDELAAVAAPANEAGVDPKDLLGAMKTTGMGAHPYLFMTGELEPPSAPYAPATRPAPRPAAPASPAPGVWDRLAQCESGGRWNINTGNGFYGGLQFLPSTWRANGGTGMPHLASRAEQIRVAERLRARAGFAPWPACSRRLGLR